MEGGICGRPSLACLYIRGCACRAAGRTFLTFDDGPIGVTPDVLEADGIRVIFFINATGKACKRIEMLSAPLSRSIFSRVVIAAWIAFLASTAWAQRDMPMDGVTWGGIAFPASAQREDKNNVLLNGSVEHTMQLMKVTGQYKLSLLGKLDYSLDANRYDYNNFLKPGVGIKLTGHISDSTNFAIGTRYEVERRLVTDHTFAGIQWFSNWYSSWHLRCEPCDNQKTDHGPLAFPGLTWGNVRYPASQEDLDSHNALLQGSLEQGVDWRNIGRRGILNTYISLDYSFDTKRHDWNNFAKLGVGVKLKNFLDKDGFVIGAKLVRDERFVLNSTNVSVMVFLNWYRG